MSSRIPTMLNASSYRTSRARFFAYCICVTILAGCGAEGPTGEAASQPQGAPDPVIPLVAAYEMQGQDRPVIFLEVSETTSVTYQQVADALSRELGVEVLPAAMASNGDVDLPALTPVDPNTGDPGVKLSVLGMRQVDPAQYEVSVEFVRSGLDGGVLIFTLSFEGNGWQITQTVPGAQA